MQSSVLLWCNRIIQYSFYGIILLVPLVLSNNTSELFELNKMWLTWGLTIVIMAAWLTKMTVERSFRVQRTPLDIPLLLFLLSQLLSTLFSLDRHISFWGYYSRFNGGFLSLLTYYLLYYAFVSNFDKKQVLNTIKVSLVAALIVALWGLPSHFGNDPTCLLFRGEFTVNCWTEAFKPTIRIFSTLGQPAWLAAYLAFLLPVAMMYSLYQLFRTEKVEAGDKINLSLQHLFSDWRFLLGYALVLLFYLDLIFAATRGGFVAFWVGNLILWGIVFYKQFFTQKTFLTLALWFNVSFFILNFFFGTTFPQFDKFTFSSLTASPPPVTSTATPQPQTPSTVTNAASRGEGGTESGDIRRIVWSGAVDVWKAYPILGSGVETFAFSYYKYRPAEHNMTSEWDFLYNKAHNEYLNYAATTGTLGIGTYLFMIGMFLWLTIRVIVKKAATPTRETLLVFALFTGYITILISNFFGFSVVIMNLYLFLVPACVFIFAKLLKSEQTVSYTLPAKEHREDTIHSSQWYIILAVIIVAVVLLFNLLRFWYADRAYALGANLHRVQEYQQAYLKLTEAVSLRSTEPVFTDELAINKATITALLLLQDPSLITEEVKQQAQTLAQEAVTLSNENVKNYPANITFWKNRVRLFYVLAQVDPSYKAYALDAIKQVNQLSPTDAKVTYNLAILLSENGEYENALETVNHAISLKPDYRDAYYAQGLFYHELAKNNPELDEKAKASMEYILTNFSADDKEAQARLDEWK